jgi:hypothetical protein
MTDANGAFRFDCIPEGPVTLEAERPDFLKPTELPLENAEGSQVVQVIADVNDIVLRLVPWAEIRGNVRSVEGTPIQDLPVHLYQQTIVDGIATWKIVASTTSDEEGHFRTYGLQKGLFILSAGPEPWKARPPRARHFGYPTVFYPNADEFAAASVISISPGQQVQADLELRQKELFEISGYVVGIPAAVDARIELISSSGTPLPLQRPSAEQHNFRGYVSSGLYMLHASAEIEGQSLQATLPLTIASNTESIQITLAPRPMIIVKVRGESVTPDRRLDTARTSVKLISSAISIRPLELVANYAANGNQGLMQIVGAEPGNYSVEVDSYGSYIKSISSGSTDLLQETLNVPENGRVAPIEVLLSNDGGELTGSVTLPGRNTTALVLLVPEHGYIKDIKATTTDPTGGFQFEQVRPGNYMVLAFNDADYIEYKNIDVLSRYFNNASHVSVPPRQGVSVNLELIHLGN